MSYNTNQNYPSRPSRPPMAGTPPQTYHQRPMPPVVQQQWPGQHPQQRPYNGSPMQYYRPAPGQHPHPVVQQQVVVQQKRTTNHGAHLILTLLTGGLWAFVWLPLWAIRGQ